MTAVYTPEMDAVIKELYLAGRSASQIGMQIHRTKNSVLSRLRRIGVIPPKPPRAQRNWTDEELLQLMEFYEPRSGKHRISEERIARLMRAPMSACRAAYDAIVEDLRISER